MLQLKVLVLELSAVDRLAAGAVVVGEVAALAHEVPDDAVEGAVLEAEPLLHRAQGTEILRGPGNDVSAELHRDATEGLAVGGHVEENLRWNVETGMNGKYLLLPKKLIHASMQRCTIPAKSLDQILISSRVVAVLLSKFSQHVMNILDLESEASTVQ